MKRLTLTRTSQPSILSESEIAELVDQFLDGELTKQTQQCTAEHGDRVALRRELEKLERDQ